MKEEVDDNEADRTYEVPKTPNKLGKVVLGFL
jgi:hypothetical protein